MASAAVWSKYTKFFRGNADGPPETFTEIPEITTGSLPSQQTDLVDVSNNQSVGPFKEWLPTFMDGGEFSLTCNHLAGDATQQQLAQDQVDQLPHNFKVEFRNAAGTLLETWIFAGYIVGFAVGAEGKSQRTAELKVRVTGPIAIS